MQIWLYFDSNGITQQQWEPVWNECYRVLQNFPVPLTSPFWVNKWGAERVERKTELIHEKGDKTYLCVNSDMASLVVGSRFELYRNISKFPCPKESCDIDILWIKEELMDSFLGRCRIWENNTRGAPYGLAMIALGILLENRFPVNCFMFGFQYTDQQVDNMRAWLSGVLKTNMIRPVCNDPKRLWERLLPLYPNIGLAIQRFFRLAKTDTKQCFEFLITQGYGNFLQNELIRRMSNYSSVSQWGVTDLLYPYLETIKDVEQVALLVKRVHEINGEKDFSLEKLLRLLVSNGITINSFQSEIVKEWNDTGEGLMTTMEGLNRLILRMSGMPNRINFYASPDKLIEIFGCMEPANGIKFVKIIEEETRNCIERYQKLEDVTDEIVEKSSTNDDFAPSGKTEIMARWTRRRYLPFEDYILREVEEQVETFQNSAENSLIIAEQLGKSVRQYNETHEKPYQLNSRIETLENLSRFSDIRDFAIRETTWEIIDNETDMDILTMLTVYASLSERDIEFWAWRKHIFETPTLWTAMRDVFLKTAKYRCTIPF